MLLLQRRLMVFLAALGKVFPAVSNGDPSPLLSVGDTLPGVLCPFLGHSVQDRHGHTEKSPTKDNKDEEGTELSFL